MDGWSCRGIVLVRSCEFRDFIWNTSIAKRRALQTASHANKRLRQVVTTCDAYFAYFRALILRRDPISLLFLFSLPELYITHIVATTKKSHRVGRNVVFRLLRRVFFFCFISFSLEYTPVTRSFPARPKDRV